jgi:hypothetical protein
MKECNTYYPEGHEGMNAKLQVGVLWLDRASAMGTRLQVLSGERTLGSFGTLPPPRIAARTSRHRGLAWRSSSCDS